MTPKPVKCHADTKEEEPIGEEKNSETADKAKKESADELKKALEPKKINHDALADELKS